MCFKISDYFTERKVSNDSYLISFKNNNFLLFIQRPILPGKDLLMTLPEGTPGLRNDSGVQLKSMKSKGSFANLKESRAVLNGRSSTSSVSSGTASSLCDCKD